MGSGARAAMLHLPNDRLGLGSGPTVVKLYLYSGVGLSADATSWSHTSLPISVPTVRCYRVARPSEG